MPLPKKVEKVLKGFEKGSRLKELFSNKLTHATNVLRNLMGER